MKTKIEKPKNSVKNSSPFFSNSKENTFFNAQPKLNLGQPNDKYEVEADQIAEKVVNNQNLTEQTYFAPKNTSTIQTEPATFIQEKPVAETITPIIQKQAIEEEEEMVQTQPMEEEEEMLQPQLEEEEEMIQPQVEEEEEEEVLMPKTDNQIKEPRADVEQLLKNTKGNGSALDLKTRSQMESGFGADFGGVKIHTDNNAAKLNKELGSKAFTTGSDIYFNQGKYKPDSQNGKQLLAHELTHTVQQGSSHVQPLVQRTITETTSPSVESAIETEAAAETCDETTEREKEAFINHGIYGPQSLSPNETQTGGFEASYNPATEILQINVRGKTRFVNGLAVDSSGLVSSHESDLSGLAMLLNYIGDEVLSNTIVSNYYTWNEAQKETSRINFRARISETIGLWQDASWFQFVVDEPCWDDIQANVQINIDVQDAGEAAYSGANNSSNDHLQVSLVKNPERDEFELVRSLIQSTAQRIGDSRLETIDTSARLTTGASVHSSRRGGGRNTNPYDSEMTLSNLSLQNTPGEETNHRSMLRESVYFNNNESELDAEDKSTIDTFKNTFRESDNDTSNSSVRLVGYASILGTTSANRRLVNLRLNSVKKYLNEIGFPNVDTRVQTENNSDTEAERYADTENNAEFFRRVDMIVGQGDLQNTVSHEFGHVFGLLDDYVTDDLSPGGTGTPAGTVVGHSPMSERIGAGQVQSENSDSMMSMGNVVRAQHYGPFGWALGRLTSKKWKIF